MKFGTLVDLGFFCLQNEFQVVCSLRSCFTAMQSLVRIGSTNLDRVERANLVNFQLRELKIGSLERSLNCLQLSIEAFV